MFNRVKGTQDFLDLNLFNFLIDQAKKHLSIYNFVEIATPILEHTELYKRSLGHETDVITKEMFIIKNNSEEESICLRPEATAATVRAFVNNNITTIPWKVFSWGPMFRHEQPQKGRYRQFYQINVEVIGSSSIYQDVQFIKMLDRFFFETLHLDTYALLINFLGCHEDRAKFKEILYKFLETVSDKICKACQIRKEKNILRIFDCKTLACKEIYRNAPHISDHLCQTCQNEWLELKQGLEQLSVSYSHEPSLVRGLDYYEKTVFEFSSDELGAQNAFCGGGRYDQLVKQIGAKEDQPSIGAALGIERVILLLERIKDKLPVSMLPPLYIVLPLSKEQNLLGILLADELQSNNLCTDILLDDDSLKSKFRKANKLGAKFVIIIGEEEQTSKMVKIKNMITGQEELISQKDLIKNLIK